MTPLVAYVLGLMTFPVAMGMIFCVRLMAAVLEQVQKEIGTERANEDGKNNP